MGFAHLSCPLCGGWFQVDEQYAGMQVACPHCQGAIVIPAPNYPYSPPAQYEAPQHYPPSYEAPRYDAPWQQAPQAPFGPPMDYYPTSSPPAPEAPYAPYPNYPPSENYSPYSPVENYSPYSPVENYPPLPMGQAAPPEMQASPPAAPSLPPAGGPTVDLPKRNQPPRPAPKPAAPRAPETPAVETPRPTPKPAPKPEAPRTEAPRPAPAPIPAAPPAAAAVGSAAPSATPPAPQPSNTIKPAPPKKPERAPSLLRDTSKVDALLPPPVMLGTNGAMRSVPLPLAPAPLPEFDETALPENPDQARYDALFDPERAAMLRLKEPTTKMVQIHGQWYELRMLTPEEKAARRLKYNIVFGVVTTIIVVIVLLVGLLLF